MPSLSRRTLLAAAAVAASAGARAQPVPTVATYPLAADPPPTHAIDRQDIETGAGPCRLHRALPVGEPPAAGWPALWMLDGNAAFNRLPAALLASFPGLAVVGVGYPVPGEFAARERARDYTPAAAGPAADGRHPDRVTGGDGVFRAALLGPLRAAAAAGTRLDPARATLWGHSYGGLFTLATLFATPGAFAAWVPVSPSTGFGDGVLARLADAAPPVPSGRTRVLILVGGSEGRSAAAAAEPRPSPATLALAARLAERPDLDVEVRVLAGLGHGATLAASFPDALATAAGRA